MTITDATIQHIIDTLTEHFGEDMAQDALVVMYEALAVDKVVENPFAFCWGVAENKLKRLLRDRDSRPTLVYLNQHDEWHSASARNPETLLDQSDPETIVGCREILNTLPVDLVMDTPLSPDEHREKVTPLTSGEKTRRWRARQRARVVFGV